MKSFEIKMCRRLDVQSEMWNVKAIVSFVFFTTLCSCRAIFHKNGLR